MGNLINRTIGEFKVQAFYQGKFMDVTREDTCLLYTSDAADEL